MKRFMENHGPKIVSVLLFAVIVMLGFLATAKADEVVLPYFNGQGYSTQLVVINETQLTLGTPQFGVGYPGRQTELGPMSYYKEPFGGTNIGVQVINVDPKLRVYSEITTPHGARIRKSPLKPVTEATFFDLLVEDKWNSGVFVGATQDTVASLGNQNAFIRGGTAVLFNAGPIATVRNKDTFGNQGAAPIYVFSFSNHHITGSLVP